MEFLLEGFGVFFLFLIACIGLLILAIIVIFILLIRSLPSMNVVHQEVNDHIETTIRTITDPWQLHKLIQNATPNLSELTEPNQLQIYSEQCEKELGKLTLYKAAKGSLQGMPLLKSLKPFLHLMGKKDDIEASENLILAEFASESNFEKGIAKFEFQLLNRGEGWLVHSLIITINNSIESQPKILTLGEKTSFETLVDENKKTLELNKILSK